MIYPKLRLLNIIEKIRLLVILGLSILFLKSHPAIAQKSQMTFEYLTSDDGLSSNRIQTICRDHDNYLWIGTENGLNKYNGYQVVVYRHNANQSGSISNNSIHCLFEDSKDNLWIGTYDGLNLYNPETDNFVVLKNKPTDTGTISNNNVTVINEDDNGDIWVGTEFEGLNKWIPETKSFIRYNIPDSSADQGNNRISDIAKDPTGNFWIVTHGIGVYNFNPITNQLKHLSFLPSEYNNTIKKICIDSQGVIWIGAFGYGLFKYNPATNQIIDFSEEKGNTAPNSYMIRSIIQEDYEHLLIATDQGGINRYDVNRKTFEYITTNKTIEGGLNSNGIMSLYKDSEGVLWIGTSRGGVNYYNPKKYKFKRFQHNPANPNSLSHNVVGCLYEDHNGLIWIGTDGDGVDIFDPKKETFVKKFKHNPNDPHSISGNVIRSIAEDTNHDIWISTWDAGLNRYDRRSDKFFRFLPNKKDSLSILSKTIWNLKISKDNKIWLGGYDTGIEILERNKGVIKRLSTESYGETLSSNNISLIYEDGPDNVWICTNYGLNLYNKRTKKNRIYYFPENNIRAFCKDRKGNLWAGSATNGIYLFNLEGTILKNINKSNGLADNTINSIIEDDNGYLWITTKNGLSKYNPETEKFCNYYETDGLSGNTFFEQSYLKTKDGNLFFGGYNGFSYFHPDSLKVNNYKPKVFINEFKLYNKEVSIGTPDGILDKHISQTKELTLKWNHDVISFSFAATNFTSPEKIQYAYILEGFEKDWNYVGNRREATYTNLDPGEYIFRVKASNNEGVWNEDETSIKINVLPPFWRTKYAYFIYVFFILSLIVLSWKVIQERERLKHHIELEKEKAARDRELDLMKIRFFTNISHEFRTPLSLILSPVDKLIKQTEDPGSKQHLQLISRNAHRLLMLINQLLDYRKMEVGQLRLKPVYEDIISFSKEVSLSFSDVSENKDIKFSFYSNVNKLKVFFDRDKLEKILLNLLSNAFKFTEEKGKIDLIINVNENNKSDEKVNVEINVKDTGIGIPKDQQEKIFIRFFQNDLPDNILNPGSGIGLSITSEFVKLHGGTISIESEVNKGSCFTVHLPLLKQEKASITINPNPVKEEIELPERPVTIEKTVINQDNGRLQHLLLVEDNEDFRFYLKDNLNQNYRVTETRNGKEAWEEVLKDIPDLIISDVMMPEIDGFELCALIKKDKRTCHVPVILLTAKASSDNKVEGFEIGADDYLAKPFYFEILESRIRNLLRQREKLREVFRKQLIVEPSEISITSLDEKLLQKAFELMEKNISNPEFTVSELSSELGMSRAHLYQKLIAITGKSPIEFIRTIRLKRAAQMLAKSQLSVSEIAYDVGFNNPKLFTKHFKNEYGITPSRYQANNS